MFWNREKRVIYKLDSPYIKYVSRYDLEDFSYSQWDKLNLDLMDSYIDNFLKRTLNVNKKLKDLRDIKHNTVNVISQLLTINKVYLIEKDIYIKFFRSLQDVDPDDRDTSLIINFYPDIVSSINNETLIKYINNLYSSLETISKDIEGTVTTWEDIHVKYPYFWLFIRISQLLMRNRYI